jgi:carboxyl-terminal processing protease
LAAVLILVLVFFVGLAVGQSGILSPASTPSTPVSVVPSSGSSAGPLPSTPASAPADFDLFWQALDIIRQNYVGRSELTDQQITYGAIKGMVDALGDTAHSVFLTPEAVQAENESLNGSVVGIGVLLGTKDDRVVVISVISGSPAEKAGIRTGDAIVSVDGTAVSGLAPEEVAPKVRGEAGTPVQLEIERPSTGATLNLSVVREELHFPAASWSMVPGTNTAMLRLVQFSTGSAAELRAARDAATAAGATSFILDLRGNPGGYVGEAVDSASLFLDHKTVYIRELADGQRIPVVTNDQIPATDAPLVVLIDQGTASSAEIVSAAIKSAGRAELVGETTFGTGTVLLNFGLPDGSAVRLAVERWLTPDGDLIFGKGVAPTIELAEPTAEIPLDPNEVGQLTPEQVATMPDTQLRRAIELLSQSSLVDRPIAVVGLLGGV